MSDHKIVWAYDDGYIDTAVVCVAPEGRCRLTCPEGCEGYVTLEHRSDGWWHDGLHLMEFGECNVELFINESGEVNELNARSDEFVIGEVDIEASWHGDGYEWARG